MLRIAKLKVTNDVLLVVTETCFDDCLGMIDDGKETFVGGVAYLSITTLSVLCCPRLCPAPFIGRPYLAKSANFPKSINKVY